MLLDQISGRVGFCFCARDSFSPFIMAQSCRAEIFITAGSEFKIRKDLISEMSGPSFLKMMRMNRQTDPVLTEEMHDCSPDRYMQIHDFIFDC